MFRDFLARAKTFLRVVEAGSLSGAARSMRVSLAAISRQLSSLERELGVTLLVRTTRALQLTDAGHRFHEHVSRLVQEEESARVSMHNEQTICGSVRATASVAIGVLRILPALPTLLEAHPAFAVDLRLDDRVGDLVADGIDLAVSADLAITDPTVVS